MTGQYAARKEEKVADKKLSIKEVIENLTEYDMKNAERESYWH